MHFSGLCDRLPVNTVALEPVEDAPAAFVTTPEEVPGYVQPRFKAHSWPENAAVLLVEAPGAVGKSAAARAIARALEWPLVLAERARVADYSLSGLVHDSLGFQSDYLSRIASGTAGLVIDSLDEALFRAGTDNFLAFIDNVQKVAGSSAAGLAREPSIVLFSRSEAADLVKLAFEIADVPLAQIALDFFNKPEAEKFLEVYMLQRFKETGRPEYNVFRASPAPYAKLRDKRMKQVAALLTRNDAVDVTASWAVVSDFLGYAPVLTAIAESLAVSNPSAVKNVSFDAQSQNDLIGEIVVSILEREQGKFASNMRDKLRSFSGATSGDIDYDDLYTLDEQCARLLSAVESIALTHTAPVELPPEVRVIYEEAAASFMQDHPFLRRGSAFGSVVFSDFVRANARHSLTIAAELGSVPPLRVTDVGPFFARFLSTMCPDGEELSVAESDVEAVVWSWEQEQELENLDGKRRPHVHMTVLDGAGAVVCDPAGGTTSDEEHDLFIFAMTGLSGAITLTNRLRWLSCFTDQGVVLGARSQQLELGSRLLLVAREVAIEAETIRVAARVGEPAMVAARELVANFLVRVEAASDRFTVVSDSPPPLLRPFMPEGRDGDAAERLFVEYSDFVDLRSALLSFRPSMTGARTHHEYMDNRVVRGSEFRLRLLEDLVSRGIVRSIGEWYYLETSRLADLGFGLVDVKTGEPNSAVLDYLGGLRKSA